MCINLVVMCQSKIPDLQYLKLRSLNGSKNPNNYVNILGFVKCVDVALGWGQIFLESLVPRKSCSGSSKKHSASFVGMRENCLVHADY